jgi:hypothetical protein
METIVTQLVPLSGDMSPLTRLFELRCEGAARGAVRSAFSAAAGQLGAARMRALCKAAGVDECAVEITTGDIYWDVADELTRHAEQTRIFSALYFLYLSGSRICMRLPPADAARMRLELEAEADHDTEFACLLDRALPADIARCPPHLQIALQLAKQVAL